ncbi:hypothetical protein [Roseomonas sp. E05]
MDATLALPLLYGLIAVALLFDFLNGLMWRRPSAPASWRRNW